MIRSACLSSLGILLLVAAGLWITPARALDFGLQAPEISPQELISGGEGNFDASVLEGKAVVLEFWATWCGPCVDAIPHWNQLVEEFADENVVFLSITDEGRRTVRRFLKKHPRSTLPSLRLCARPTKSAPHAWYWMPNCQKNRTTSCSMSVRKTTLHLSCVQRSNTLSV